MKTVHFLELNQTHSLFIMLMRKIIRRIFILSQLFLALHYSYQSFISWNDHPIVTSVSLRSIKEVPFPAVSICHDVNSWKWPGIVNAMDLQDYEVKSYYLNHYDWMHHLTNRLKAVDIVFKKTNRYKVANNGTSLTLAKALLPKELYSVAELLHYVTFVVKRSYKLYGFFSNVKMITLNSNFKT